MADNGLQWLADEELQRCVARAEAGDPLPAGDAARVLDELRAARLQLTQLKDQALSNEMLLDCKIAAGMLLDPAQADRVDLPSQAQQVARNQLAILDELERIRFLLDGGDETR